MFELGLGGKKIIILIKIVIVDISEVFIIR